MPYIIQDKRSLFLNDIKNIVKNIETEGELNYVFSKICHELIDKTGISYKNLATCISALENAKLEFYRKVVAPYEDKKEIENGKV